MLTCMETVACSVQEMLSIIWASVLMCHEGMRASINLVRQSSKDLLRELSLQPYLMRTKIWNDNSNL